MLYYLLVSLTWANPGPFLLVDGGHPLSFPDSTVEVRVDGFTSMAQCQSTPPITLPFVLTRATDGAIVPVVATEVPSSRSCRLVRNRRHQSQESALAVEPSTDE